MKLKIFDIFYINERIMDLETTLDIEKDEYIRLTSKRNRLLQEIQNMQNQQNNHSIFWLID